MIAVFFMTQKDINTLKIHYSNYILKSENGKHFLFTISYLSTKINVVPCKKLYIELIKIVDTFSQLWKKR